ncbi:hypothetical protein ACP70R_007556 [Stipagrostis hirtigluma subsp. patula]
MQTPASSRSPSVTSSTPVSYMEIYNEDINDLLTLGRNKLPIHNNLESNRHFGETNMNVRSSRSYTIFRMVIESRAKNQVESGDAIRVSVLNLVDLAGSERVAKTGAVGARFKEAKHINKRLMNLGIVINMLSESGKQIHIPNRNSKLTRILEPALGGNAKTSIICTATPEESHIEETKGTLQYASRAKCVNNCAQVNEILTDAPLIKRQKREIEELRKRLQGSDSEAMQQVILKQSDDMHKFKLERDQLAMELEEERKLRETHEHRLSELQKKLEDLNKTGTSADPFMASTKLVALKASDSKCTPNGFVTNRRHYSKNVEFSPIPEILGNVADEDLWRRLNKGRNIDLNMLAMTPGLKSTPSLLDATTSEPTDARCQRLEKDCISDQQVLFAHVEKELGELRKERDVLREEKSSLQHELSRSKEEADRLITVNQELLKELHMRCPRLEKDCNSDVQRPAGRLAVTNQELVKELNVRCPKLEKDCESYAQLLEDSRVRCTTLEEELCRSRCAAAEEELSRSKAEAGRLTAEKLALVSELDAERKKAEALVPDISVAGRTIVQQEQRLTSLLAKSKAILEQYKVSPVSAP